jgi:hypothetical protein
MAHKILCKQIDNEEYEPHSFKKWKIKIKIDDIIWHLVDEFKYLGLKIREHNEDDNFIIILI